MTLESNFHKYIYIYIYIDIPNLRNVSLPDSFKYVNYPVVNSHFLLCLLIIDVSELLFPKVYGCDYIQSIDSSVSTITLPPWTCNEKNYTIFDISRFSSVRSIEIRDNSFSFVKTFKIDGLNRLSSLIINKNSFTQNKYSYEKNELKSFHILNCESLASIQIGRYSFSDFAGDFEIKNLSRLQSIQIGSWEVFEYESYNFYYSSFVIRGIDMIRNN